MKKILPLLISIFVIFNSQAQFSFGGKAGLNLNDMAIKGFDPFTGTEKPVFGSSANIGFHFGVYLQIPIVKNLFFQPEFQFIQRGMGTGKTRVNILYADLPLLINYSLIKKLGIEAGPVLSYNAATSGFSYGNATAEPFSIGLQGGLSFSITEKITLAASYYHGLAYTWQIAVRDEQNRTIANNSFYNRNIHLGVRYTFIRAEK